MAARSRNHMQFIRKNLMDQAIKIHNEDYNSVAIIFSISENNVESFVRTEIETVQNTLNFNVFGANIRLENCIIQRLNGKAIVDVFISLLQVSTEKGISNISESQVKLNKVISYEGNDFRNFVKQIPKMIAEDWSD